MSELHDAILRLSGDTETRMLALHSQLLAGSISREQFGASAVTVVGRANALAYGLADVSLVAAVEAATARPTAALGMAPAAGDADRLRLGVATLLASDEDITARLIRFARAEPVSAFQDAYVTGMNRRGVKGYVRVLSPGACQLCQWLNKEDYVYPAGQYFHRHEGCTCHPSPVIT